MLRRARAYKVGWLALEKWFYGFFAREDFHYIPVEFY